MSEGWALIGYFDLKDYEITLIMTKSEKKKKWNSDHKLNKIPEYMYTNLSTLPHVVYTNLKIIINGSFYRMGRFI